MAKAIKKAASKKAAKKPPPKKVSKARQPKERASKYDTKLQVNATFDELMGELFKPKTSISKK